MVAARCGYLKSSSADRLAGRIKVSTSWLSKTTSSEAVSGTPARVRLLGSDWLSRGVRVRARYLGRVVGSRGALAALGPAEEAAGGVWELVV